MGSVEIEEWRPVVGFEGLYEVSTLGNVRGLPRVVDHPKSKKMTVKGGIIKPWICKTNGYRMVALRSEGERKSFTVARLMAIAFLGLTGDAVVDHIDRNRTNDVIGNLRVVTRTMNSLNSSLRSNNTSGVKGVTWNEPCKKWLARISFNREEFHLGLFDSRDAAVAAYETALISLSGS